ncbi:MAG TPA: sugar transferase [Mycobacteriales bacterium]|nr:sugar transferase [Mycobacteriales bacterium]
MYVRLGKRILDVVLAGTALAAGAVLLLVVAVAIKTEDRGPVFYRQQRVGRGERMFVILKFRSMPTSAPSMPSAELSGPRVTRVGRVIRRLNVDELPQLLQIVQGHMSIVGPRPALLSQEELIRLRRQNGAFVVRPGLTGLAQVRAYDGMPDAEKAAYDGEYASSLSFARDMTIIARTVLYLLRPPPTY